MPREFVQRVIVRGILFWILMHVTLAVFRAAVTHSAAGAQILDSNVLTTAIFVGVLAALEMGIRRERVFISNLGIAPSTIIAGPAIVATLLDIALNAAI